MISLKKITAGLLAAAITACSFTTVTYANNDTSVEENDDQEQPASVPVLAINGASEYIMKAGFSYTLPISLYEKERGNYSYIKYSLSSENPDITVPKSEVFGSLSLTDNFRISVAKTTLAGNYNVVLTAKIYDKNGSLLDTQNLNYTIIVTNDLDASGLVIDSWNVSKEPVKPGDTFELTVNLKNKSGIDIKDAELELTGLDSSKFILDKGFTKQYLNIENGRTGSVKFSLIAQKGIAYVRETLGLSLSYTLDKNKPELSRNTTTSIILKCEPAADSASSEFGAHDLSVVGYNTSVAEIKNGTKFSLTVEVKNNSKYDISGARIIISTDGSKFSLDSGLGYKDFDIKAGTSKNLTFDLIGGSGISSIRESIPFTIEFAGHSSQVSATVTCVPAAEKTDEGAGKYDLTLTDYSVSAAAISENVPFTLTLSLKNSSGKNINQARINIGSLDGSKFAADGGLTYKDIDIAAGATKQVSFPLIGCSGISSVREVIPIEINYGDISSTVYATVTCVPKSSNGTDENGEKVFAPNIIIESYDFGGEFVTAGQQFPLSVTIKNTSSSSTIENLKVNISGSSSPIDGSMAYSPANSSNSFFFEKLDPKGTQTINIDFLAKADATPNSYPLEITFSYEYSVGKERFQATPTNESITIPLRQEDRLTINDPELPSWAVNVGEMVSISTSIVNKGKSAVYNVTATVEGDGFMSETPSYYIGNINSGTEEYYDAKLTPYMEGDINGELVFTYEDANGASKETRIPFTFSAMSMNFDGMYEDGMFGDDGMMPDEEKPEEGFPLWAWFAIGGGALIIIIVSIIIIVKVVKKKKKAELEADDEDL